MSLYGQNELDEPTKIPCYKYTLHTRRNDCNQYIPISGELGIIVETARKGYKMHNKYRTCIQITIDKGVSERDIRRKCSHTQNGLFNFLGVCKSE